MPRRPPHFKVFTSLPHHRKMIGVYGDDSLLAMYVRAGMMAIERYADRTDDSFLLSGVDLIKIAGCEGVANALRKLARLEARSPIRIEPAYPGEGGPARGRHEAGTRPAQGQRKAGWRLTMPNLAKKQGFTLSNGSETEGERVPSSTTTTTTTSEKRRKRRKEKERAHSCASISLAPLSSKPPACRSCGAVHPRGKHPMALHLSAAEVESLLGWCGRRGFTEPQARYATGRVRGWHEAGGKRKACWVATIRNGMTEGWALKGYVPPAFAPPARLEPETIEDRREAALRAALDRLQNGGDPGERFSAQAIEAEAVAFLGEQAAKALGLELPGAP